MEHSDLGRLTAELLVVLATGLLSGLVSKRFGSSLVVGYLVAGAVIGGGGLRVVSGREPELQILAEAGALLLLFAIGLEFSLDELRRLARPFWLGGTAQLTLVAAPLVLACRGFGMSWNAALLAGLAGGLSSTVLVFRALSESGATATEHGRRAIAILLFQDVALVPLLLLVPMLTGQGGPPTPAAFVVLGAKSTLFVVGVLVLRWCFGRYLAPLLTSLRSVELVVLFTLSFVGGVALAAVKLGLPAAVGAFSAGLALGGNRLSEQIDKIVLPFREAFAAVFFVSLGMLLRPGAFLEEPLLLTLGLAGMLLLKTTAAALALRLVGLSWRSSLGMGLGLAQLGEFAFLLVGKGLAVGLIGADDYNRMLFIAIGTLLLTPILVRVGLEFTDESAAAEAPRAGRGPWTDDGSPRAVVIGAGPIGRQLASRLETAGSQVTVIDLSPINLHPFAQLGFATVAGDARDADTLRRAAADAARLAIVSVPADDVAVQVVQALREQAPRAAVLVRCRFQSNVARLVAAGATHVVSEEAEASGRLLALCDAILAGPAGAGRA